MDTLWIFISSIIVLGFSLEADAGCAQDLQNNKDFQSCFLGYSTFITNAAQNMDPNNPNGIMNLLCSKTGREKIKCALKYIESCPALMTTGNTATAFSSFQSMKQMGGFDGMCRLLSGNVPTGPCTAVTQCISAQETDGSSSKAPNGPTPFSVFQYYIGYMCGPLKGMLDCFKDTGDQCSHILNDFKTRMEMEKENMGSGATLPSIEKTKMFVTKECPTLPADFSTNLCVKNSLMDDNFVTCFQNITTKYITKDDQTRCNQYRAGHQCVSMYVGKKCGNQYTKALEKMTPLFMAGIPSNCKLESEDPNGSSAHEDPNGSSAHIQMSSLALLVALLLSLKLK